MKNNKEISGNCKWTDNKIMTELKDVQKEIHKYPSNTYLRKIGRNDLRSAVERYGGNNKFRKLIGCKQYILKPCGYWSEETIKKELQEIITKIGHFPTDTEIRKINEGYNGLSTAIVQHGGYPKFRKIMGVELPQNPQGYWSEEQIISELKTIITKIGHFPIYSEIEKSHNTKLIAAIHTKGGINKFRTILGYDIPRKPKSYWTDDKIIEGLREVINNLGHFPTRDELVKNNRRDLANATHSNLQKFRQLMGYKLTRKINNYWSDTTIIDELKKISKQLNHFPTYTELKVNKNGIVNAINRHGRYTKFKQLLDQEIITKPSGYWSEKTILEELKLIIDKINHFPTRKELKKENRYDLINAISKHGGSNKFRELLGYELLQKPSSYWTEEVIIRELNKLIKNLGHFPTHNEMQNIGEFGISTSTHSNLPEYRTKMGYDPIKKPEGFWSDENIIKELKTVISKINRFPSRKDLIEIDRQDLQGAINENGGTNKFRDLCGCEILQHSKGYWSNENIIKELKDVISVIGHFPSYTELADIDRQDICGAINANGGYQKFKSIMGYTVTMQEKYRSELMSYINKRGKSSEKLFKKIITDYCILHNLPYPSSNVKLSNGNIIEFVCNTNKRIGIDVTNTENKRSIFRKWTHKTYHKHLDELWIVVFSDVFTGQDYHKWNRDSPDNVKVMSIHQFLDELDYSIDEYMKSKIENYCKCTFHTKEEFKSKNTINISY